MPFTFAHPAIVLLTRRYLPRLSLTGLVIGSMAPDFEYFIRMRPMTTVSHTVWGILWFDLPITIIVSYLFHALAKVPLVSHLPNPIDRILLPHSLPKWQKTPFWILVFLFSCLVGISSHIGWDSFSHVNGSAVAELPLLASNVTLLGFQIPIYKLIQHGSTMLGLSVILIYTLNYFSHQRKGNESLVSSKRKIAFWLWVLFVACLTAVTRVMLFPTSLELIKNAGTAIVSFISGGMLGLVSGSLIFRLKAYNARQ